MPTGYTVEVMSGKINTFKDYAKICARAFGATIHMKEDSLSNEYEPQKPSTYYIDWIKDTEKKIKELNSLSDAQLISKETKRLKQEFKEDLIDNKRKVKACKRLKRMLEKAKKFTPPTLEHIGHKRFMIEQLEETIKWECDISLNTPSVEKSIASIDAKALRKSLLDTLEKDLKYYKKKREEDVERVNKNNKWVQDLFDAL